MREWWPPRKRNFSPSGGATDEESRSGDVQDTSELLHGTAGDMSGSTTEGKHGG